MDIKIRVYDEVYKQMYYLEWVSIKMDFLKKTSILKTFLPVENEVFRMKHNQDLYKQGKIKPINGVLSEAMFFSKFMLATPGYAKNGRIFSSDIIALKSDYSKIGIVEFSKKLGSFISVINKEVVIINDGIIDCEIVGNFYEDKILLEHIKQNLIKTNKDLSKILEKEKKESDSFKKSIVSNLNIKNVENIHKNVNLNNNKNTIDVKDDKKTKENNNKDNNLNNKIKEDKKVDGIISNNKEIKGNNKKENSINSIKNNKPKSIFDDFDERKKEEKNLKNKLNETAKKEDFNDYNLFVEEDDIVDEKNNENKDFSINDLLSEDGKYLDIDKSLDKTIDKNIKNIDLKDINIEKNDNIDDIINKVEVKNLDNNERKFNKKDIKEKTEEDFLLEDKIINMETAPYVYVGFAYDENNLKGFVYAIVKDKENPYDEIIKKSFKNIDSLKEFNLSAFDYICENLSNTINPIIHIDNKYIYSPFGKDWLNEWFKNQWRKKDGSLIAFDKLWSSIYSNIKKSKGSVKYVSDNSILIKCNNLAFSLLNNES